MKYFSLLLSLVLLLGLTPDTEAQTAKEQITVTFEDAPLTEVFSYIEKNSRYSFFYDVDDIDVKKTVSARIENADIESAMTSILKDTSIDFYLQDKQIVLSKHKDEVRGGAPQGGRVRTVSGKVTDQTGLSVIGAAVMLNGTTKGVITETDGSYSIEIPESVSRPVLTVSCLGYDSVAITVGTKSKIDVVFSSGSVMMEELVVVGYGTMKKKDLTGAVSSIKMKDEPVGTVSSISHALAGKAAGLQVNLTSAQPGAATTMRIRGAASISASNDPLIIIDGFPVNPQGDYDGSLTEKQLSDNILGSLNPNDIESIDVLKDASSTAIYGSRAANGVILVTTKKGATGKPKVSYSGTASAQFYAKRYEVLDAEDFMRETNRYTYEKWLLDNKVGVYGGVDVADVPAEYTPRYTDAAILFPHHNTDWFDEITRTGFQTQHNLSVTGGTDWTKYFVSFNYFRQNGLVKENDLSRYTGRVNLEQKLAKWAKMGVNMTISRNVMHGDGAALGSAAAFNPLIPVKDRSGEWGVNPLTSYTYNPVALLDVTKDSTKDRLLGTAFLELNPLKGLTLKAAFGIDRQAQSTGQYTPITMGPQSRGNASAVKADKSDYTMDLTATYANTWGKHSFTAMAGYSFQHYNQTHITGINSEYLSDIFGYNNLDAGGAVRPQAHSYLNVKEMASFFGRVTYNYADRYLLTATMRADGSSVFALNNRWGYFPSAALAWRFSEEPWMQGASHVISNGKLRVGYGQTGNASNMDGAWSYYRTGIAKIFGGSKVDGVAMLQLGNPDLRWETTSEWNFGLDLGFFEDRLNITAEYYRRVIKDLLNVRTLQNYNEIKTIADNIGKTRSSGFELTIGATIIDSHDFLWKTDLTFSFYRDKWLERADNWVPTVYDVYDAPVRPIYTYLSDGIIMPGDDISHMPGAIPGQVMIKDIDSYMYDENGAIVADEKGQPRRTGQPDGKIDDADKVLLGSADPDFLGGMNNTFKWRNIDLGFYFYGQFGVYRDGGYKWLWLDGNNLNRGVNMPVSVKDTWSHDNQDAKYPTMMPSSAGYGGGDFAYHKIWFIRCRNITLGYTLPKKNPSSRLSNFRIYAEIQNPFVISPYDGLDPETDNSAYAYPNVRSLNFGIDLTF